MEGRVVGNFKELPYGDENGESIEACKGRLDLQYKDKVISYLKEHGKVIALSPGISRDYFDNSTIGPLEVLGDGVWEWTSDLSYYVEKYDVDLPKEFLQHIESK